MPDVVHNRSQSARVTQPSADKAVAPVIFNPIRIVFNRRSDIAIEQPKNNVVISEKLRIELDTARMISGETPTPAVDGVHFVFTTAYPYVAGTLHVTRASLRMHPTADYSETSPAAGTFTMVIAPDSSEPLLVDYVKA